MIIMHALLISITIVAAILCTKYMLKYVESDEKNAAQLFHLFTLLTLGLLTSGILLFEKFILT